MIEGLREVLLKNIDDLIDNDFSDIHIEVEPCKYILEEE